MYGYGFFDNGEEMTTTNLQGVPYLKTQWQFPYDDQRGLANQLDIAYIEIASKVNARIIGTYAINFPIVTSVTTTIDDGLFRFTRLYARA